MSSTNKGLGESTQLSGTSIFDPALCETIYSWFCPVDGLVVDPFAGGSVRGVVASKMGRQYVGVELREEQVLENRKQAERICSDPIPVWKTGDSRKIDEHLRGVVADFVFSCPPYADLEKYSELPEDLSNMPYGDFIYAYREIIKKSCSLLNIDSFACFVVSEVRGANGFYYGLVPDTISAFKDAGLEYYNEIILVNSCGSLPIRVGKQFKTSRKIGRTHQNVLVFVKGDPVKAAARCGDVEIVEIEQEMAP